MAGLIPVIPSSEDTTPMTTPTLPVAGFIAGSFIVAGLGGVATAYALRGLEHHKQALLVRHARLLSLG
jgi:hypothetical protein